MTTETEALELLGQGYPAEAVAAACGVTASRISQLMADEDFAAEVAKLKMQNIKKSSELDTAYDDLEAVILKKLKHSVQAVFDPMKLQRILQTVNQAKRRSTSPATAGTGGGSNAGLVQITLPNVIMNKYVTNINNQVVEVRDDQGNARTLLTATTGQVARMLEDKKSKASEAIEVQPNPAAAEVGQAASGRSYGSITAADL